MASDESEEEFFDAEDDSFILEDSGVSQALDSVDQDNESEENTREVLPAKVSSEEFADAENPTEDKTDIVENKDSGLKDNDNQGFEEGKTSEEEVLSREGDVNMLCVQEVVSDSVGSLENHTHSLESPKQTDPEPVETKTESQKQEEHDNSVNDSIEESPNLDTTSLKTQTSDSSLNSERILATALSKPDESGPPPIPPPRRKRKKKLEALAAAKVQSNTDSVESLTGSTSDETKTKPGSQQVKDSEVKTEEPVDKEVIPHEDSMKTVLEEPEPPTEEDIVIQLDFDTLEMHSVLDRAKTLSTQVVSEDTFEMMRTKSASVNSLGGTGSSKSGSFVSIENELQCNGSAGLKKSGSHHSLGSAEVAATLKSASNLYRTASFSGRPLSDAEILEQVIVTNLDTGESIPLSIAEETLPQCTNPLSLQIMRLTSEYSSNPDVAQLSDGEDHLDGGEGKAKAIKKKTTKLKSFIGKTVHKIKQKAEEGHKKAQKADDSGSSDEESTSGTPYIKIKSSHKGPVEFERLRLVQELSDQHVGAVWTMKFSCCGRLLATAGQDNLVRVWVLKGAFKHFEDLRNRYSKADDDRPSSPTASEDSVEAVSAETESKGEDEVGGATAAEVEDTGPFCDEPFCTYEGHTGDVLDLSWSKNYFLLSSSMDKTVRLWHISRRECLCCFQHIDFVTAITFHPRDDRYFLSGSLDGKIRLWNIPDKKVALWNEVEGSGSNLITAANFCINGKFAVVGTYDGRCIFYVTESLKYHTQIHVRPSRKKHAKGRKISGIEAMPGEDKVLITSNDSRIRLYDLKDHSLYCKYKGYANSSSQIKGTFSPSGQYIICGSEDRYVYIWRTHHGVQSARRDRNDFYESFSAHDAVVTTAIFAPIPSTIIPDGVESGGEEYEVIVTADWTGKIKLFVNR